MDKIKRIKEIFNKYPDLTFDNNGYQYLSNDIIINHCLIIRELEDILKTMIDGFTEFNNFKIRPNKDIVIRCQYKWDVGFYGVGYFPLKSLKAIK